MHAYMGGLPLVWELNPLFQEGMGSNPGSTKLQCLSNKFILSFIFFSHLNNVYVLSWGGISED